jgi:hypothetical protein
VPFAYNQFAYKTPEKENTPMFISKLFQFPNSGAVARDGRMQSMLQAGLFQILYPVP